LGSKRVSCNQIMIETTGTKVCGKLGKTYKR